MWEIEPIEVKVTIKDKKPPERIAENEVCKIGLDPCYIIVRQEGVIGESIHEFLYINNSLNKVENIFLKTCEVCGRLVIGKNNFPYEVSFESKEEKKCFCDSCIEKYKGWDNYVESKLLFGTTDFCEDCGKPTQKVLRRIKIKVQACEECVKRLIDIGFEKTVDSIAHKSALPFPIQLKDISKKKQIHKLKLTKSLIPYTTKELPPATQKNVFDEPIEQPRKIPQSLIKQKIEKEEKIKIKEKQNIKINKIILIMLGIFILLTFIGVEIIDNYSLKELSETRDTIKQEQIFTESTNNKLNTQIYSLDELREAFKMTSSMVIDVRERYNEVEIILKDSEWYKLDETEKLSIANELYAVVRSRRGSGPVSIYDGYGRRVAFSVRRNGTDYMAVIR